MYFDLQNKDLNRTKVIAVITQSFVVIKPEKIGLNKIQIHCPVVLVSILAFTGSYDRQSTACTCYTHCSCNR